MYRRMTLGAENAMNNNNDSNINQSSIGPQRTQSRPSEARSSIFNRPSMASNLRVSLHQNHRNSRGSINHNGNSTTGNKDPRPIREKSFQKQTVNLIITWLSKWNYPYKISNSNLERPTTKDFSQVFSFLYGRLDPYFIFDKKIEEQVPQVLKTLRYPFVDQISKSQLAAIGALHSWPPFLAILGWLTNLVIANENVQEYNHNNKNELNDQAELELVFLNYLTRSYSLYLSGSDDYSLLEQEVALNFEKRSQVHIENINKLTSEISLYSERISELKKTEFKLDELKNNNFKLITDKNGFSEYINQIQHKVNSRLKQNLELEDEFNLENDSLNSLLNEKELILKQIETQELSAQDIERMNREAEQIQKNSENFHSKYEETTQISWRKELELASKLEEIDKVVKEYNNLAYQLGLIPLTAPNSDNKIWELNLNHLGEFSHEMVNLDLRNIVKVNLKNQLKPKLLDLKNKFNQMWHSTQDILLSKSEVLDELLEQTSNIQEQNQEVEHQVQKIKSQIESEKMTIKTEHESNCKEMTALEEQIKLCSFNSQSSLAEQTIRKQLLETKIVEVQKVSNDQQKKIMDELTQILKYLIEFKENLDISLEDYLSKLQENDSLTLDFIKQLDS